MRTYPGLASEIDDALTSVENLRAHVFHWGAAGVRANGQKAGAMMDEVNSLKARLSVLRAAVEQATPKETVG